VHRGRIHILVLLLASNLEILELLVSNVEIMRLMMLSTIIRSGCIEQDLV
jgi:hypothetical protein